MDMTILDSSMSNILNNVNMEESYVQQPGNPILDISIYMQYPHQHKMPKHVHAPGL